jgi:hypothetical protein
MLVQIGVLSSVKVSPKSLFYDEETKIFYTCEYTSEKTKENTDGCKVIFLRKEDLNRPIIKDKMGYEYSFKIDKKSFEIHKCYNGLK